MIDNQITCETVEEHNHAHNTPEPSLSLGHLSSPPQTGHAVPNPTPNQPIQGVSGNTYAPMDTNPQPTQPKQETTLDRLMDLLNATLREIVKEVQTQNANQTQPQVDLIEAVDVALGNADWFRERIEDSVTDAVDEKDFDYEIGEHIERYMRNSFDPNDHVDFAELVNDRVDDVIDDMVQEAVDRHLEEHLSQLIEDRLTNATIRIDL